LKTCAASDLHRKKICQPAVEHKNLSQDKLNALLQTPLHKPELARSTVTGILKERTKWLASFVEETIKAPSLRDTRQQLKGLAVFLADRPQFSAQMKC